MIKRLGTIALIVLLLAVPAQAWNNKGHMLVAYIAYVNLDPAVRQKVDKLLERHPDFQNLTNFAGPSNGPDYHLIIFMNAATWPDFIRDDARFYDETDSDISPTKKLPGFPTMMKLKPWHYIDLPYQTDGSPVTQPSAKNALKALRSLRSSLNNTNVPTAVEQAYYLAWLLHIAGDVHQPLHCISRFTKKMSPPKHPDGDRGGNEFEIAAFPVFEGNFAADNLHSFWDNALGVKRDLPTVRALATGIMSQFPKPNFIDTNEQHWINESYGHRKFVYSLTPNQQVPPTYVSNTQKLARQRVAIAGYRIARVLNERFK